MRTAALILFFALTLTMGLHDIWNGDLGFHLTAGRWIHDHGEVPRVDDFSYTARGRAWMDFEWLYQWWTYEIWRLTGPPGVVLQHALLNVLCFAALAGALARHGRLTAMGVLLLLLALFVCEIRFTARPHAVGRVFLAVFAAAMIAPRREASAHLWWLLPLQAIWANLHGTYVLSLLLAAFLVADELLERKAPRRPLLLLAGLVLAGMANPYGWRQAAALWRHHRLTSAGASNPEWMPLPLTASVLADPAVWCFAALVLVGGFILLRDAQRNRNWLAWGIWTFALFAPFVHVRLLDASAILLVAAASTALPVPAPVGKGRARLAWAGLAGLLLLLGTAVATDTYWRICQRYQRMGLGVSPLAPGWGAGSFLAGFKGTGDVFNSYATGGWLMWWLYPQDRRVFIDGRDIGNVYTPEIFAEYLEILDSPDKFQSARRKYSWNAVVLERNNALCHQLIAYLDKANGWKVAYSDEETVVFLPLLLYEKGR